MAQSLLGFSIPQLGLPATGWALCVEGESLELPVPMARPSDSKELLLAGLLAADPKPHPQLVCISNKATFSLKKFFKKVKHSSS